jgi:hypothetical protein
MTNPRIPTSNRIFHWLILAYPPSFRQQFGGQMESACGESVNESYRRSGWLGAASTSVSSSFDVMKTIIPAYLQDFKEDAMQHKTEAAIGGILVLPAMLLMASAVILQLAGTNLFDQMKNTLLYHSNWPVVAFVRLPLLAVLINIIPTLSDAYKLDGNPLRYNFVRSHAFGLTVMLIGAWFVFFLFGHDTVGCMAQGLQHPTNYIESARVCWKIHG